MNLGNFFSELKRRNVYKVAVAYVIAAWLIIQAASILLPTFEAPTWVMKVIVMLLVLGFPAALIFSWAFEMTPEGIVRESDVDVGKSITHHTGRKIVALTIVLAIIAAGLFVFRMVRTKSASTTSVVERAAASVVPNKSIAVLPFDNLSRDPENAYFCEGVQDEILTRLAKVADLKVISRTSTQRFKSSPNDLPAIAKQLGVMHILEGSVQKANDQVRVNVQLIHAMSDAHVWADTYDRKLTDIFAIESEIAKTIADTLQAKLTGSEKTAIAKVPTSNNEAYELYLQGRFFWNKRTAMGLKRAIDYFNQAIAKDPNYALAYSGLADSYLLLSVYGAASPHDSIPQAKVAAKKALELDDSLAEAHTSWARILCAYDFAFEQAIAEFERAIELNPNYATAHHWISNSALSPLGYSERAYAEGKRSVELDPLSMINNADLGNTYYYGRQFEQAVIASRKAIEIDPNSHIAHYYLGEVLQSKGQSNEAIAEYKRAVELDDDPQALACLGQAYARWGKRKDAEQILARLTEEAKTRYVSAYNMALMFLGLGEKEKAIDALERSYNEGAGNDIYCIRVDPMLDELRKDPRFEALAEKIVPAAEFKGATASK
jgi:TolB-like protein/Tfp pilus assembly protein PilF